MNKNELLKVVAEEANISQKKAGEYLDTIFECISDALADGEEISISTFGKFTVKNRKAREGRNPKTGKKINIPAKKIASFKPFKPLKEKVN